MHGVPLFKRCCSGSALACDCKRRSIEKQLSGHFRSFWLNTDLYTPVVSIIDSKDDKLKTFFYSILVSDKVITLQTIRDSSAKNETLDVAC